MAKRMSGSMRCYCSSAVTKRKGRKKGGKRKSHKHKKGSKSAQGRKLGRYSKCLKKEGRSAAAKAQCRHRIFD